MEITKHYTTKDVLKKAGISRNTLFLWFKREKIPETTRDRNGHRIFSDADVKKIINYKDKLILPKK